MSADTPVAEQRPVATSAKNSTTKEIFDAAFARTERVVEFNPKWSNGTGLFDFAVYGDEAPVLPAGSISRSITPHGRKLLLIGSRLGNIVIFERTIGSPKTGVTTYCHQAMSIVKDGGWFSDMVLDEYELELAVGTTTENHIGRRIDLLYASMKKTG